MQKRKNAAVLTIVKDAENKKEIKNYIDLSQIKVKTIKIGDFYLHKTKEESLSKNLKTNKFLLNAMGSAVENLTAIAIDRNQAFVDCTEYVKKEENKEFSPFFNETKRKIGSQETDEDISNALKVVFLGLNNWERWNKEELSELIETVNPNKQLIENIRAMVRFNKDFLHKQPNIQCSFSLEVFFKDNFRIKGRIDFLSSDTIYELKVIKKKAKEKEWLQPIIYFLLGKKGKPEDFKDVTNVSVIDAREKTIQSLPLKEIPFENIELLMRQKLNSDEEFIKEMEKWWAFG